MSNYKSREQLLVEYASKQAELVASGELNTQLAPADKCGWFTRPENTRATWRGVIERIHTPIYIHDGVVIGFMPVADFKAPSWRKAFPIRVDELRKR